MIGSTIFAAADSAGATNPPPLAPGDQGIAVPLLSNQSLFLSIAVLLFGVFVIIVEYKLLFKVQGDAREGVQLLTVSLIIVVALALVSAGYGKDQITPVLGLFGTIVGYLLGAAKK